MLLYGSVPCLLCLSGVLDTWQLLSVLFYHVVRSLRDEVTLLGRGCVMYTLSIVTRFHTEPPYLLGGSELLERVHTLRWIRHFGLTPSIGTKA